MKGIRVKKVSAQDAAFRTTGPCHVKHDKPERKERQGDSNMAHTQRRTIKHSSVSMVAQLLKTIIQFHSSDHML